MMNAIRKMALSTEKAINLMSKMLNIVGVGFLVAMMMLTVADVFLRYAFNKPILGTIELTEFIMAIVSFSGLAWCAAKSGHARVTLIVHRYTKRAQGVLNAIAFMLCLSVVPLVAWQGFAASNHARITGKISFLLEIPAYPFYIVLGVGFTVLTLVIIVLFVKSLIEVVKG